MQKSAELRSNSEHLPHKLLVLASFRAGVPPCRGLFYVIKSAESCHKLQKTSEIKGFSLKGTKIDQWVKAGTGQEKIRSSKRWSDFSLYTDENSSEVTTISELFGFYEFIFGVIPMLSSSSASSCRLWTFSFLYAFLR